MIFPPQQDPLKSLLGVLPHLWVQAGNRAVNKTDTDLAPEELTVRVEYTLNKQWQITMYHVSCFHVCLILASTRGLIPGSQMWKMALSVSKERADLELRQRDSQTHCPQDSTIQLLQGSWTYCLKMEPPLAYLSYFSGPRLWSHP